MLMKLPWESFVHTKDSGDILVIVEIGTAISGIRWLSSGALAEVAEVDVHNVVLEVLVCVEGVELRADGTERIGSFVMVATVRKKSCKPPTDEAVVTVKQVLGKRVKISLPIDGQRNSHAKAAFWNRALST